jgi:nickel transport protein
MKADNSQIGEKVLVAFFVWTFKCRGKNMTKIKIAVIWFAVISVCAQTVFAHHLWVSKKDDLYAVCRGLIPESLDTYDPSRVVDIMGIGKDGSVVAIQRQDENHGAFFRVDQDIFMVAVRCDWGHRVNTTQGKKLMTRQEAEQAGFRIIDSFFSTQFCKTLFASSDEITKPVNIMFEFVPEENPYEKVAGELFKVKLIFEGKPLSDTSVYTEKGAEVKTDQNGVALIKIEEKGMQLMSARHKVPAAENSGLDYHMFTTFLNFQVK